MPARKPPIEETWPASKTELWPIEKIKPYAKNPRTHSDEQTRLIAASMASDGVTAPILVDEEGEIIAGHGRRLAAIANGFTRYPVIVARGWSDDRKRAVRLKDNSLASLSGWNKQLMTFELAELQSTGFDLLTLGLEEYELRSFGIGDATGMGDPEDAPEPPANPVSRIGDLWLLQDHRLLCGDSTKPEDVERVLAGARPPLMVTDPPYGVEYDANWRNEAAEKGFIGYGARAISVVSNDDRIDWTATWKLFPGDVVYCWHAGRHASEVQSSLESARFEMVSQIIWAKPRFVISRGDYHWQHEPCWYAVRKGAKHRWAGDRSQTTLWSIPHAKSETGHSTQKPIECMKRPIENNSKRGDGVYEPFSGSFTTGIACEMTGRKCFAIELMPAYIDVGVLRWQTLTGKEAILESSGQTYAEVKAEREKPARRKPPPAPTKKPCRSRVSHA